MTGKVVSISAEGNLLIELNQASASSCAGCAQGKSCQLPSAGSIEIKMPADQTFLPGDQVEVELPARTLLALSTAVYIMPLLPMTGGALWGSQQGENTAIAGGFGGLLVGLIIVSFINRLVSGKKLIQIERIP